MKQTNGTGASANPRCSGRWPSRGSGSETVLGQFSDPEGHVIGVMQATYDIEFVRRRVRDRASTFRDVRRRVRDRAGAFDSFPGLTFKAFLIRTL